MRTRPQKLLDKLIVAVLWCWYGVADKVRLYLARRGGWVHKNQPLVSIIMPTIGRDASKAIKSVIDQTYQNWELLVITDGLDVEFKTKWMDSRIYVFPIEKKLHYPDEPKYHWLVGPVRAINHGLSMAVGDWIARIDDDDVWDPKHLERMLQIVEHTGAEFISGDIQICGGIPLGYSFYGKPVGAVQSWLYRGYLKCFKCSKHSWRRAWDANNDIDLPKRMARAGVRFGYDSDYIHARVEPREGLHYTGLDGWLEECSAEKDSSQ